MPHLLSLSADDPPPQRVVWGGGGMSTVNRSGTTAGARVAVGAPMNSQSPRPLRPLRRLQTNVRPGYCRAVRCPLSVHVDQDPVPVAVSPPGEICRFCGHATDLTAYDATKARAFRRCFYGYSSGVGSAGPILTIDGKKRA